MEIYAHFLLAHHCCVAFQHKKNRLQYTRTANVAVVTDQSAYAWAHLQPLYFVILFFFLFIFRLLISFVFRCTLASLFISVRFLVYPNSQKSSLILLLLVRVSLCWFFRWCTAQCTHTHSARLPNNNNIDTKRHQMNDGNRRKRWKIRRRFQFYVLTTKKKKMLRKTVNYAMCAFGPMHQQQGQTTQYYCHLPFWLFLFFLSFIMLFDCTGCTISIFVRLNRWMDSNILSVGDECTVVLVILLSRSLFVHGSLVRTRQTLYRVRSH